MPDNEVRPLQSGPPLLTEQKEVDMANKKKGEKCGQSGLESVLGLG